MLDALRRWNGLSATPEIPPASTGSSRPTETLARHRPAPARVEGQLLPRPCRSRARARMEQRAQRQAAATCPSRRGRRRGPVGAESTENVGAVGASGQNAYLCFYSFSLLPLFLLFVLLEQLSRKSHRRPDGGRTSVGFCPDGDPDGTQTDPDGAPRRGHLNRGRHPRARGHRRAARCQHRR